MQSVISLLAAVAVAAFILALNFRISEAITAPYYAPLLGAVPPTPPYSMKEIAIDVHVDRGWPIWHTRATSHFAAHNAYAYFGDDGLGYAKPIPVTDYSRVSVVIAVGLPAIGLSMLLTDKIVQTVCRTRSAECVAPTSSAL